MSVDFVDSSAVRPVGYHVAMPRLSSATCNYRFQRLLGRFGMRLFGFLPVAPTGW